MVGRLKPWRAEDGSVIYQGWARMALPLQSFTIVEVAKPNIGEKQPSMVRADVTVHLGAIRQSYKLLLTRAKYLFTEEFVFVTTVEKLPIC